MPHLVAVYARISKDDVGDQTSTGRQLRLCRQMAAQQRWRVVETFEDVDRSAFAPGVVRDGYEELLDLVASGRIDTVLVWRLDRLVRSSAEFERFWAACQQHDVTLASATEPVDSSNPVGLAIIRLLVTFAGLESDVKSIRLKARNRELAEAGRPPPGGRTFGHTAGFTAIVPEEAALIREAAERLLRGESTSAIARDWRARGLVGIKGVPWTNSGLRTMLQARRLSGDRTYHGEVVAEGCWPAILDPLTAAEVRSRLAGRPGGALRQPEGSLLRGRARCGACGSPLHPNRLDYRCSDKRGCGTLSIRRQVVDDWITAHVFARLEARQPANHRRVMDRRQAARLIRNLDQQGIQLRELNRRYLVTAELTYPEWIQARDDILQTTERVTAHLTSRRPPRGFPPGRRLRDARQLWDELTTPTRRDVIAAEMAWLTVQPSTEWGGAKSAGRLEATWHLPDPPNLQVVEDPTGGSHTDVAARATSTSDQANQVDRSETATAMPGRSWDEARRYLGVGNHTLSRLVADGRLQAIEGARHRFTTAALQACIERCRIQPLGSASESSAPASLSIGSG